MCVTLALMSVDITNITSLGIVELVRSAFPEDAALADGLLLRDGFDENAHFIWLEHFSQLTTDAIKRLEFTKVNQHLNLFSHIVAGGDEPTVQCIDVAYVESLMWDIKDDKLKREGWKLIPANLRTLYVAMWGERSFMNPVD